MKPKYLAILNLIWVPINVGAIIGLLYCYLTNFHVYTEISLTKIHVMTNDVNIFSFMYFLLLLNAGFAIY